MIKFLLKGLWRDRSRSLFPVLTVATGVTLCVFLYSWLNGVQSEFIRSTAHFSTGHLNIMSRAYAREADQVPNDLALIGIDTLLAELRTDYPEVIWTPRIRFGGLLDIPDKNGETRVQGPVSGLAVNLFTPDSPEWKILNIRKSIVRGRVPEKSGEILIGDDFARKLMVFPGDIATLISSTMYGSMSMTNFTIVGTVRFGVAAMDRSSILADFTDIQNALDMQDAAGEILGFFRDDIYHNNLAEKITASFNASHAGTDQFSPEMATLQTRSGLSDYLNMIGSYLGIILTIFVVILSIVLWNAGLMGSLRRYGEIGVRLAVGEDKGHIYKSMLIESIMIGIIGSILGTVLGVAISYYLQIKGVDITSIMKNTTMMISNVIRAQVTPVSFFIGFIPGLLATFLGSAISGIGIYRRQTSQLFKELEV
jgi:putative ABC transport system permease protein